MSKMCDICNDSGSVSHIERHDYGETYIEEIVLDDCECVSKPADQEQLNTNLEIPF